jgi:2-polyprenyl-6-hydroxyphenyl methylase/3-demethylubiquinone-9 3-methyltransferase
MKLPSRGSLVDADHLFLHEHDCRELHNPVVGDFKRLTYVRHFELVLRTIERWARGRRVLDVGCAQGNFSLALAERGFVVVALDLRPTLLQYLRLKHEVGEVHCVGASLENYPFGPGAFDVVLLTEVIEHVAYPEMLLRGVATLLRPGGILVLTTPNGDRLHTGLPTLATVGDRQALLRRQFQPDADGHLFLLTRGELLVLMEEAGLEVVVHEFLCSPWVTGHLKARHLAKFLPVTARLAIDLLTVRSPPLGRFLSSGQLLVARRATPTVGNRPGIGHGVEL